MRGLIIISILALSTQRGFALLMTPRIPQANPSAPAARLTTPKRTPQQVVAAKTKAVLARVTVYWASGGKGSDRYSRRHQTATGCRLQTGHCAVDPRHVPYGSQVILSDGTKLAAVDTGSAVRTRKAARQAGRTAEEKGAIVIDRFFETKRQALAWANTHPMFMPVRVMTPEAKTQTTTTTTTTVAKMPRYALTSSRSAESVGNLNKLRN